MHYFTSFTDSQHGGLLAWADRPLEAGSRLSRLGHALVRIILITISEFRKNDLSLRSGALTYTVLLSLVPILAMSTAVVKGLGGGDQLRDVAYRYVETLEAQSAPSLAVPLSKQQLSPLPVHDETDSSDLAGHLRSALDKLFAYVDKTNFATLGTVGMVGILLSVILVLSHIEMAMNTIWHVYDGRSIMRKVSDYLTLMVLMPISINVAFAASAFLKNPTLATKFKMIFPFLWLQTLILKLVPVFFIAITFYVIYIFFPNIKVRNRPAMIGATLAAILWFAVQNVYISLQVGVAKYNAIYGSFATLPLFLVWMYLGWLFILGGAQLAYACQNRDAYRLTPDLKEPSLRLSAAFDIVECARQGFLAGKPYTLEAITERLTAYDASLVQNVVDQLTDAEALHLTSGRNLLVPAADLAHGRVLEIILGADIPDTAGGRTSLEALRAATEKIESQQVSSSSHAAALGKR